MSTQETPTTSHPPRGPSTMLVIGLAVVALAGVLVGTLWGGVVRDTAGWAGRQIGLLETPGEADGHDHATAADYYTCGMHPWVILPEPGDCPICHMALTPLDPAKFTGEVAIDPVVVQNIGVRTREVTTGPLVRTVRTVGTVDYDETRVRDVNTKISGWIEELYVDSVGAAVKAGDPLFAVYSPDLFAAQQEYLSAWRNRDRPGGAELLEATRTRLGYFDISDAQIRDLQERGEPSKTLTIKSPHDGVVIDKHANEGMKIDPGMRVYRIADLSQVWLLATVYEYQLPFVEVGQTATISLPYVPGKTFQGTVTYIYPYINEKSREAKVRVELANPEGRLKPGMFASVTLQSELAEQATLVPREAVIDTGRRQVAFVSLGEGRFEPRDVQLGVETEGGLVQVLDGLEPGEKIVTSGQFLLDSEAKMRESLAKMIRGDMAADQEAELPAVAGEGGGLGLDADQQQALADRAEPLVDAYLRVQSALTQNELATAASAASELRQAATDLPAAATLHQAAAAAAEASDLAAMREHFATITAELQTLLAAAPAPALPADLFLAHCPMVHQSWIQAGRDIRNPYAPYMLTCGELRGAIRGQQPPAEPEAAPAP